MFGGLKIEPRFKHVKVKGLKMSVLKTVQGMMTKKEIEDSNKEYLEETAHLRRENEERKETELKSSKVEK